MAGHRNPIGRKRFYISDKYTKFCPNNNATVLPPGGIEIVGERYREHTTCPVCDCKVTRSLLKKE